MADDYTRGEMDISEHKATYSGVMNVSVYSTLVISVVLLCLTLIFGGGFSWINAMMLSAVAGGVSGYFLKQGTAYWVTLAVLAVLGFISGGLVSLLA